MQRLLFLGVILLSLLVVPDHAVGETEQPPRKLNLGVIVPLTGPLAFFGKDYVRAFDIALEEHPEIAERFNIFWEDSAYDSKQAVTAFNKLVGVSKVDIVYSFGGPMLNVLAPLAEARKVPFFASESAKSDCEGKSFCFLFRNEEDEWGKATWAALRKRGVKKLGLVKNQNQFMNTFADAIARTKADDETVEIVMDVPPETADLRSNVVALQSKSYDALGVYLLPTSHHGFLKALSNSNKHYQLIGVEELMLQDNIKAYKKTVEGALVVAPGASAGYREKFEKRHGYSAGFFYTPAFYDFCVLLNETAAKQPHARGAELVQALQFKGTREGVSGRYSLKISPNGVRSYSFPIAIYRVGTAGAVVEELLHF